MTMTTEEFQHLARLYVVGTLDPDELERFTAARGQFGPRGEAFIDACRTLVTALALSLDPIEPRAETKQKLMEKIRSQQPDKGLAKPAEVARTDAFLAGRASSDRRGC